MFCWRFPEKTQIIPICIHQAHACTLLLSSNMQLETYVAQLSSVLYYVLNKNGCIIGISRFKSHSKRLEVIIVSCQTHLAFCFHFCLTLSVGHICRFFFNFCRTHLALSDISCVFWSFLSDISSCGHIWLCRTYLAGTGPPAISLHHCRPATFLTLNKHSCGGPTT